MSVSHCENVAGVRTFAGLFILFLESKNLEVVFNVLLSSLLIWRKKLCKIQSAQGPFTRTMRTSFVTVYCARRQPRHCLDLRLECVGRLNVVDKPSKTCRFCGRKRLPRLS